MLSKTQIKYIQSLFHKKFREQYREYLIEGPKMLWEAIASQQKEIRSVYALSDWADQHADLTKTLGKEIVQVTEGEMRKISSLSNPGPVLAIMGMRIIPEVESFQGITLLLDGIQDPGNLGTMIRTADWFGIQHLICGEGCVDCYNPKVIQSTMGSIFRMNINYTSLGPFLSKHRDIPVLASSLDGTPMDKADKPGRAFLIIGNESRGVSEALMKEASLKIRIPGGGEAESLNAAVAAGILLYWITRSGFVN